MLNFYIKFLYILQFFVKLKKLDNIQMQKKIIKKHKIIVEDEEQNEMKKMQRNESTISL